MNETSSHFDMGCQAAVDEALTRARERVRSEADMATQAMAVEFYVIKSIRTAVLSRHERAERSFRMISQTKPLASLLAALDSFSSL